MAKVSYRPKTSQIPTDPGVYRFYDKNDQVIYVGKAKNLRNRLTDYFQDLSNLTSKTKIMVTTAVRVEWTVVQSELEALTLEYSWIKEYNPRYNIIFRDDKSYPYLAITMNEQYPRVFITRSSHKKGVKYFGPYSKVWAIRETMDNLCKVFKIRTCTNGVFRSSQLCSRPCLLGDIGKCSAPCVGRISPTDYYDNVKTFATFMSGRTGNFISERKKQMLEASKNLDFEKAASIRDEIYALESVLEKNTVVLSYDVDVDVFGMAFDELSVCIVLFHVRSGRIRGVKTWMGERIDDSDEKQILSMFLTQTYTQYNENEISRLPSCSIDDSAHYGINIIPKEILVSIDFQDRVLLKYLSDLRKANVKIRKPIRGDKAILTGTAVKNAKQILQREKLKRLSDITSRSTILEQMRLELDLPTSPLRIECFDSSHIQGSNHVCSMVVFEDALPKKKDYRSYNISLNTDGSYKDDTAAMEEVLMRRFSRLLQQEVEKNNSDKDSDDLLLGSNDEKKREDFIANDVVVMVPKQFKRFSYRPDLVVIDGGLPQVNVAKKVLDTLGLNIPVVGLAKRLEELYLPNDDFPIILPRQSDVLYLLQYIRDESHRFAISLHRRKRAKSMLSSSLDSIEGLGNVRRKALLDSFGSICALRKASVEDIARVKGISVALAERIYSTLQSE